MTPTALIPAEPRYGAPWLRFAAPRQVLVAERIDQVLPVLRAVEAATTPDRPDGAWAVGYIAYEAAPAFDRALAARRRGRLPYAWWALFDRPETVPAGAVAPAGGTPLPPLAWRPAVPRRRYLEAVAAIRRAIARGDTYQVNLTFPLRAPFDGDPLALFAQLARAQRGGHAAFLDTGRFAVCSASPELFFARDGGALIARPMKGTARRGRTVEEDARAIAALRASAKDRAENLMIVDMMRNDLGRIAVTGSVAVPELFAVETYPTVHQMTSTVTARSDAGLVEVLAALFPCASITGAPKVSTMAIIRALERAPRGVYTGTVGMIEPGGRARFNVAIRTAVIDRRNGVARYGVGGGIVWDSDPEREYDECRAKALILTAAPPPFELLETLRWTPKRGYGLRRAHLARLAASAAYFGFRCDLEAVGQALDAAARGLAPVRHRVRLTVAEDGTPRVEATAWPCAGRSRWRLVLDDRAVDERDPFLCHKTTHREVYERALARGRARCPEADEVLLYNRRGELTESCRANLVLRLDGAWLTPAAACGLLAGTYRGALLARGRVREAVLPRAALARAEAVFLVNALRGWIRVDLGPAIEPRRSATMRRTPSRRPANIRQQENPPR